MDLDGLGHSGVPVEKPFSRDPAALIYGSTQEPEAVAREARAEDRPDAGPAGMAQVVLPTRVGEEPPHVPEQQGLRLNLPKNPLPGQRRPPCSKREVEINGGCWVLQVNMEPPCGPRIYEWKKGCYLPTSDPAPPPTSDPP